MSLGGSVLSGVGGSAGGWRCCWGAPSLPQLPLATPKNPPPYIGLLFLCFCSVLVGSIVWLTARLFDERPVSQLHYYLGSGQAGSQE